MKKLTKFWIYSLAIIGVVLILSSSCKKKDDNNIPPQESGTVTDKDGNVYHTVTIGTQVWMVENLKTTKYNDGTSIPLVTDNVAWFFLTTPGYCYYENNAPKFYFIYGALYNWYAANTGNLAPTGWHIPTDAEWTTLTTYLGGESIAGGKLKEEGTTHWYSPNTEATDEYGFTALPGGCRDYSGNFANLGSFGPWWSSSEYNTYNGWYRSMYYGSGNVDRNYFEKSFGFSIRCIKD